MNTKAIYKSIIDGRLTTEHQYITEIICKRIAAKEKRDISANFWKSEYWKRTYRLQLMAARSLLKIYSAEAIIEGLRQCKSCYSLRAKFLDEKIKLAQKELEKKKQNQIQYQEKIQVVEEISKPREAFKQTSILDRL